MAGFGGYDTSSVLAQADAHPVAVLGLCGLALIGNYVFWIDTLRLGFRARVYTMPVPCVLFFLCHDLTFVASYSSWFRDIDHWFPKLWWFGLILTVCMELAFLAMLLRFGREEIAPELSRRGFVAATLVGLAVTGIAWLVIKSVMSDQLYLIIFGFTVFWCSPWYLALTWRRKDPVGQSVRAWVGYLMMPAFYWPATMILSPAFRTPLWIALGVVTFLGGLANLAYVRRLQHARMPESRLPIPTTGSRTG